MAIVDKVVNSENGPEPRRRRQPEAARENILAAAETMLVDSGPQSLKLAEVARAAGVSNASVLHYFGSIDGVQTALMERLIRQLVERVLAVNALEAGSLGGARASVVAMFDAFEARGAARLAAWLELTGQARRLTLVREAVREVVEARVRQIPGASAETLENFMLACIVTALGVGLFAPTMEALLDKPVGRAREIAIGLLLGQIQATLGGD